MQRAESSQRPDISNRLLDAIGYPKDGNDETKRIEWVLKFGLPVMIVIGLLGLVAGSLIK